jgi:hypothetical protein
MIFKGKIFTFLFCVVGLIAYSIFHFSHIDPQDIESYRKLMTLNEAESESYSAKQERFNVSKQILFTEGSGRMQMVVRSNKSVLQMRHENEKNEIVEHFDHVKCYMQEELYDVTQSGQEVVKQRDNRFLVRNSNPKNEASWLPATTTNLSPKQVMRYMEASEAQYHYSNDQFIADQVKLSRYVLPGHQLIESLKGQKALMSGIAKSVEFNLGDKGFSFKAQEFKGTFIPNQKGS